MDFEVSSVIPPFIHSTSARDVEGPAAVTGQVPHSTACDFQEKDTAVLGKDLGKNFLTPRTA
jgi:hypothetical protein